MSAPLKVHSSLRDYEVFFEKDLSFLDGLAATEHSICVADAKVFELYQAELGSRFPSERCFLIEAIEDKKTLEGAQEIYTFLTRQAAKKNLKLIAVGGGISQDLAGFAASTIYRGVEWIYIPTTLLAQADSCIGGKTSLNFGSFKNLLGTFYPPSRVHIYAGFLKTLARQDFFSGLGEIIKLQLMKEGPKDLEALAKRLERAKSEDATLLELIRDSLDIKTAYIEGDEFDQGKRNLLNFGHCFGHALETASEYRVPHGIAVNIGMIFANLLAVERGLIKESEARKLNDLLHLPNLFLKPVKEDYAPQVLLASLRSDKKRTGSHLSVVLPDGKQSFVKLNDVTDEQFFSALAKLMATLF